MSAVAALAEPTRRRLYDHVVRQPAPVGRDDVAEALGVPRATVAFHLDRLAAEGLLDVHYERRSGRTGPGAGRPAKLYRRSDCPVTVSLPERRYDLAGQLLAGSLVEAERTGESPAAILGRRAYQCGHELAQAVAPAGGPDVVRTLLEDCGYEPRVDADGVALANCPFHALAQEHTDLICGMNLGLLQGLVDGVPEAGLTAVLRPAVDACCVRLDPDGDRSAAGDDGC
jgi:predicted ArsR family transcriptional regulator